VMVQVTVASSLDIYMYMHCICGMVSHVTPSSVSAHSYASCLWMLEMHDGLGMTRATWCSRGGYSGVVSAAVLMVTALLFVRWGTGECIFFCEMRHCALMVKKSGL